MRAPSQRNDRIVALYPLVRQVAGRVARRIPGADLDELSSAGVLGLIDAVDKYDPSIGVPLPAYAAIRVRGAVLDAVREADWAPRRLRRKGTEMNQARLALQARLGRPPTDTEIASELHISPDRYHSIRADAERKVVAMDEDPEAPIQLRASDPDALDAVLEAERSTVFERAVAELDAREATLIEIIDVEGRSLKEAGAQLGVSESRACQLHTRAVGHLRRTIGEYYG